LSFDCRIFEAESFLFTNFEVGEVLLVNAFDGNSKILEDYRSVGICVEGLEE